MTSTVLARMYFFAAGNEGAGVDSRVDADAILVSGILYIIGMVAGAPCTVLRPVPGLCAGEDGTGTIGSAWALRG